MSISIVRSWVAGENDVNTYLSDWLIESKKASYQTSLTIRSVWVGAIFLIFNKEWKQKKI